VNLFVKHNILSPEEKSSQNSPSAVVVFSLQCCGLPVPKLPTPGVKQDFGEEGSPGGLNVWCSLLSGIAPGSCEAHVLNPSLQESKVGLARG
jgi:hypothetical protein